MKLKKSIEGSFLILLFLISALSCIYSRWKIHDIDKQINSPEFINTASTSISDAYNQMLIKNEYETMFSISFIFISVFVIFIIVWFLNYRINSFLANKTESRAIRIKYKTKVKETPDVDITEKQFFCPKCGKKYEKATHFCDMCGWDFTK